MSDIYQALAHPARRQILTLLRRQAMSAGDLADAIGLARPTMSGHFNILKEAGLITVERNGVTLIYRLNMSVAEDALSGLMDLLRIGDAPPEPSPLLKPSKSPKP